MCWKGSKSKCYAVVQRTLVLEIDKLALFHSTLHAIRTEMLAVDFHIAKAAQKSAAAFARDDGFLFGVVEAGRLFGDQHGFAALATGDRAV